MDLFKANGVMADLSRPKTRTVEEGWPWMVGGASSERFGARSSPIYSGPHGTDTLTSQSRSL